MVKIIGFIILISLLQGSNGASKEEWKSRAIYQLLTDRFSRTDDSKEDCQDLSKYCGGTWVGLKNHLDYIKGMGFDAIWISPTVKNIEPGYHGYWMSDPFDVNEHFGTKEELKQLVDACHEKGIYVMADVVANHVGPVKFDYKRISPFDKDEHYHAYCHINSEDFKNNQWRVENCRLADLPDLNQENHFVLDTLLKWINGLVNDYGFDGLRIDTVPEVPKWFWEKFRPSAGVFTLGEVWDDRLDYVRGYIGPLDSTLNYPLYIRLRQIFQGMNSFWGVQEVVRDEEKVFGDLMDYMGLFISNHDNERFLHTNYNLDRFKGAIAFTMTFRGIPIFYYGDEQGFKGANDPGCREALWPHMDTNSELYKFTQKVIKFRQDHKVWDKQYKLLYQDDHLFVFMREDVLCIFCNADNFTQDKSFQVNLPDGTTLCNVLKDNDCTTVQGGSINVHIDISETKLYEIRS